MKILLFGKDGQIGSRLHRALAPLGDLTALGKRESALCGDIADLDGIAHTIRAVRPDVIVNAAAYTRVDQAEAERDTATRVNGVAPGALAQAARQSGALLIHYSTDYVFDGSGTRPWRETDAAGPINFYGETKREGELAILTSGCRHLIFRTSWIYGWNGKNFPKTILRLANEQPSLRVITDQVGAPTPAFLVADITARILPRAAARADLDGIYHLAAAGATSWYDYACNILTEAARLGMPLRIGPDQVQPVTSAEYPTPAVRPLNSRLDTHKLRTTFGIEPMDWQSGLRAFLNDPDRPAAP